METSESKTLDLGCNLFHFKILNQRKSYSKYIISFTPSIDNKSLIYKVWDTAKKELSKLYKQTTFFCSYFYSTEHLTEDFSLNATFNNIDYSILIKFVSSIDQNSQEIINVYTQFMNTLIKRLNYKKIKNFYFNKSNISHLNKQFGEIEILPGFTYSIKKLKSVVVLNLNMTHKLIGNESIFDYITKHNSKSPKLINHFLKGKEIVTKYNRKNSYTIYSIDFMKNPKSVFKSKYGVMSYVDYYFAKYSIAIKDILQPLIVIIDYRTKNEIHLIPELCYLIGLSNEIKQDYYLMKEVSSVIKSSVKKRFDECKKMINAFNSNEKTKELINCYKISISSEPISITGKILNAGNMLLHKNDLGDRAKITIDDNYEIEKQLQSPLYCQPPLNEWVIFALKSDSKIVENFIELLMQVKSTFQYPMDMPIIIYVHGNEFFQWESQINNIKNYDSFQILLFIIPGTKENDKLYNELKKYTLNVIQCPSQIILSDTIAKAKNIKSVMHRLFIQIVAKLSGEPWVVNDMPFTDMPTMVCGIDSYDHFGGKIFGICSSLNKNFTRYASGCFEHKSSKENINSALLFGFKNFSDVVGVNPLHCIIIRNNTNEINAKEEVQNILAFFKDLKETNKIDGCGIKLTYILLNKKSDLKVMLYNNFHKEYETCPTGTIIKDYKICSENEFYLISQKFNINNYAAKYTIIYDNFECSKKDLYNFLYKLCHLYFNFTSSIKIPAPCKYASKLVKFVGENLYDEENNRINFPGSKLWEKHKSLYFI